MLEAKRVPQAQQRRSDDRVSFSFYSLLMALVWSGLLILILHFLKRAAVRVLWVGITSLVIFSISTLLRMFLPLEFQYFTCVIANRGIFAWLCEALSAPIFLRVVSIADVILAVWISGMVVQGGYCIIKLAKHFRMIHSYMESDGEEIVSAAQWAANRMGVRADYRIVQSNLFLTPMITGFFRPTVLLPPAEYGEEEYRYIFLHEFSHWKNGDIWLKMLAEILRIVFWWNPFMYLFRRDLDQILELRADLRVLKVEGMENRSEYLLTIKKAILNCKKQLEFMSEACTVSELTTNLEKDTFQRTETVFLYQKGSKVHRILMSVIFTILTLTVLVFSYMFILQPAYDPPESEIEEGGYIGVETDNSYLQKQKDGSYCLIMVDEAGNEHFFAVDDSAVEYMLASGVPVKK